MLRLGASTVTRVGDVLIPANISPFFTRIVTGVIILAAIWLNSRLFRTAHQARRKRK